jgi:hypothetical protein
VAGELGQLLLRKVKRREGNLFGARSGNDPGGAAQKASQIVRFRTGTNAQPAHFPRLMRYFFDVRDGGAVHVDSDGTELADLEEARREALTTLAGIAKDELPDGDMREFMISVRDGDGWIYIRASLVMRVEYPKRN